MVHALNPSTQEAEADRIYELEASLQSESQDNQATQKNPAPKQQNRTRTIQP